MIKGSFKRPRTKTGIPHHKNTLRASNGRIKRKKGGLPSISKLIKACDKEFSMEVRKLKVIGIVVFVPCFTCGNYYPPKKLHCGHYLSRYYKAARWNFDNARPQCMMCNMWKRGDPIVFRRNLIAEIGIKRVEAVEALRDAPIKLSREYLTTLLEELKTFK